MELDEKAAEPIAVDQQEAASASAPNATAVEPTTGFEDALDEMQRRLAELRADVSVQASCVRFFPLSADT